MTISFQFKGMSQQPTSSSKENRNFANNGQDITNMMKKGPVNSHNGEITRSFYRNNYADNLSYF